MAAPIGNKNATKTKRWAEAIDKAIKRYANKELGIKAGEALDKLAIQTLEAALAGDRDARQEIGNRLDGKPHQSMDIGLSDNRSADDYTDDELAAIATAGRARAADPKAGKNKPPTLQ